MMKDVCLQFRILSFEFGFKFQFQFKKNIYLLRLINKFIPSNDWSHGCYCNFPCNKIGSLDFTVHWHSKFQINFQLMTEVCLACWVVSLMRFLFAIIWYMPKLVHMFHCIKEGSNNLFSSILEVLVVCRGLNFTKSIVFLLIPKISGLGASFCQDSSLCFSYWSNSFFILRITFPSR